MKIVVTGSIAFDYLMSFPGKFLELFLPEHLSRVSLSFLVDTMDRRRGGCGPNIAYTLALLGERPLLMGTGGEDHGVLLLQHRPGQRPDCVVLYRRDGPRGRAVAAQRRRLRPRDYLAQR